MLLKGLFSSGGLSSFTSSAKIRKLQQWVYGGGGGGTRLPKFKFSANFPIGLHLILQKYR